MQILTLTLKDRSTVVNEFDEKVYTDERVSAPAHHQSQPDSHTRIWLNPSIWHQQLYGYIQVYDIYGINIAISSYQITMQQCTF